MSLEVINISQKLKTFSDHWHPRIVGELNGQHIKIAKLKGEFVMHHHENEDEMFLVIKGALLMELDNDILTINAGEFVIIPKGVNHKPIAKEEVEIMLFEPSTTINTGNITNQLTKSALENI